MQEMSPNSATRANKPIRSSGECWSRSRGVLVAFVRRVGFMVYKSIMGKGRVRFACGSTYEVRWVGQRHDLGWVCE